MANTEKAPGAAKALILIAVCLTALSMPLTFTGPAVALPAIGRALGGSPIALNWVTNAFMLTFGSSLMAAGALADAYGRKRMFLTGTAAFGLLSLAAAAAPSILWLDLARAAQGVAAALAFAGGAAALAQEFDDATRMRAFSLLGASFGIGLAFGPILSGVMIDAFGWASIFLPVAAATGLAFVIAMRFMHESRDPAASGLDWPGATSFTAALALLTYSFLKAPEAGWGNPIVIGLAVGAVLCFIAFVAIERRATRPMLDLTLFRYPRFVGIQLLAAAPAYAFVVLLVLLPVRFIGVEGMSEVAAGQLMIALSAPLLVLPLIAGQLARWVAPAVLCATGLVICAAGLFWLSGLPADTPAAALVAPMATIGIGISLPWGLMDGLAVSVVPKERAGMATGIFNTTRVAGEGLALAVVSAVLSALTAGHLAAARPVSANPAAADTVAAAQRLVTGDLAAAQALLPGSSADLLVGQYSLAFSTLLLILTAITVATAIVVFLFMGRRAGEELEAEVVAEA